MDQSLLILKLYKHQSTHQTFFETAISFEKENLTPLYRPYMMIGMCTPIAFRYLYPMRIP